MFSFMFQKPLFFNWKLKDFQDEIKILLWIDCTEFIFFRFSFPKLSLFFSPLNNKIKIFA